MSTRGTKHGRSRRHQDDDLDELSCPEQCWDVLLDDEWDADDRDNDQHDEVDLCPCEVRLDLDNP